MASVQYASEIEEVEQRALWPGFIPEKSLTVLMGESGTGKSSVARLIVRMLTRGEALPNGWRGDGQGVGVIWISNEEDTAGTLVPELRKVGADLGKIRIMSKIRPDVTKLGEATERKWLADREEDLALLRLTIWDNVTDNIGLIVIDAARGMSNKSISHPKPCREVLEGLQQVAEDTSVAILLLHHVNRSSKKTAIERIGGSTEMYNFPRCVVMVSKSEEDNTKMSMSVPKPFLCASPPSLTYQRTEGGGIEFVKGILPEKVAEYEAADCAKLDGIILAFLAAHPDQHYAIRQVCSATRRNYNVVAKQLQRLEGAGRIEKPHYGVYCALSKPVQVKAAPTPAGRARVGQSSTK